LENIMLGYKISKWMKYHKFWGHVFILAIPAVMAVLPFCGLPCFTKSETVMPLFGAISTVIGSLLCTFLVLHAIECQSDDWHFCNLFFCDEPKRRKQQLKSKQLPDFNRSELEKFRKYRNENYSYKLPYFPMATVRFADLDKNIDTHNWVVSTQQPNRYLFVGYSDVDEILKATHYGPRYVVRDDPYNPMDNPMAEYTYNICRSTTTFCECADCGTVGMIVDNLGVVSAIPAFRAKYPQSITAEPLSIKRDCHEQQEWNKYISPLAEMLDGIHANLARIDTQKKAAEKQSSEFELQIDKITNLGKEYKKASEPILRQLQNAHQQSQNKVIALKELYFNLNKELHSLKIEFCNTCNAFDVVCKSQRVLREAQVVLDSDYIGPDISNQLSKTIELFRNDIYAALGRIESDLALIPEIEEDELIQKFHILEQAAKVRVE
jgi:hypothetical protein